MSAWPGMFRTLDANEEKAFRKWARENYKVGAPVSEIWHPSVQDECRLMNNEAALALAENG